MARRAAGKPARCPACGEVVDSTRRFCSGCGHRLPHSREDTPGSRWRARPLVAALAAGTAVAGLGFVLALSVVSVMRWAAADDLDPLVRQLGIGEAAALGWLAVSRVTLRVESSPEEALADLQFGGSAVVPVIGWLVVAVGLLAGVSRRLASRSGASLSEASGTAVLIGLGYAGTVAGFATLYEATVGGFVITPEARTAAVWASTVGLLGAALGVLRTWSARPTVGGEIVGVGLGAGRRAIVAAVALAAPPAAAGTAVLGRRLDVASFADVPAGKVASAVIFAAAALPDIVVALLVASLGATVRIGTETLGLVAHPPFSFALLAVPVVAIAAAARSPGGATGPQATRPWVGAGLWVASVVIAALALRSSIRGDIRVGGFARSGALGVDIPVVRLLLLAGLWTAAAGLVRWRTAPIERHPCPGCGRLSRSEGAAFCVACGHELDG